MSTFHYMQADLIHTPAVLHHEASRPDINARLTQGSDLHACLFISLHFN
jgi:hypothetical protein